MNNHKKWKKEKKITEYTHTHTKWKKERKKEINLIENYRDSHEWLTFKSLQTQCVVTVAFAITPAAYV